MKIGICDDDRLYLSHVRTMLEEYGEKNHLDLKVVTAENGKELLDSPESPLDAVFLDIRLQSEDGIELARKINYSWKKCQVVYLTNYLLYATDVYQTEHIYFVLKSELPRRLEEVFHKISVGYHQSNKRMIFKLIGDRERAFLPEEILYFERKSRKTYIHTAEGSFAVWEKIDQVNERLLPEAFVRCHNSYIVYLPAVQAMHAHSFLMNNGAEVPISRRYQMRTKAAFAQWALLQIS